jgi:hypothetical protein
VTSNQVPDSQRLAIRPYPREREERTTLNGARLLLRPIRPEDESRHRLGLGEGSISDFLEKSASTLTSVNAITFFLFNVLTISNAAAAKL